MDIDTFKSMIKKYSIPQLQGLKKAMKKDLK